jgi:hypothetical protein
MSKKNTKAKRIFALLMAVLIAVTYMPTSLYAYAEDYVTEDQVAEEPTEEVAGDAARDSEQTDLVGAVDPGAPDSELVKLPAEEPTVDASDAAADDDRSRPGPAAE